MVSTWDENDRLRAKGTGTFSTAGNVNANDNGSEFLALTGT